MNQEEHNHLHELGIAHTHAHAHPHVHENQKAVSNRLARAIGAALESTGKVILQDHIQHCIVDAVEEGDEQAIRDLCAAIDKFIK